MVAQLIILSWSLINIFTLISKLNFRDWRCLLKKYLNQCATQMKIISDVLLLSPLTLHLDFQAITYEIITVRYTYVLEYNITTIDSNVYAYIAKKLIYWFLLNLKIIYAWIQYIMLIIEVAIITTFLSFINSKV